MDSKTTVNTLLKWYRINKRDLPWRGTRDPYLIWVSEVIMQQTRIDQGTGYYHRFVERFPDVASLAAADEQEVLKIWQGLGYYSRARNMHAAARTLMEQHQGRFPETFGEIRKLKGIGDYSAASIASLSFSEARPAVDVNVIRFISRLYGIREPAGSSAGKKKILQRAAALIVTDNPGECNQALIEFGALWCKPARPDCPHCIFRDECQAFRNGWVDKLPLKSIPNIPRIRYFHYLVISRGSSLYLRRREEEDIWKNLYDFPLIETETPASPETVTSSEDWNRFFRGAGVTLVRSGKVYEYKLSHQTIHARFYEVRVRKMNRKDLLPVTRDEIRNYPLPRLIEKYLDEFPE
jgi:A/G-specific adenine glycosylase